MDNTKLVSMIKLMGSVPENQNQFPPNILLDLATDEMNERMLPFLIMLNQGATDHVFPFQIFANVQTYALSSRASYGSVRDIRLLTGSSKTNLLPIDPTQAVRTAPGSPGAYHFQKSRVVLDCPPAADGLGEYTARLRPSKLTETTLSAKVTAFDPILQTITLDAVPNAFAVGTLIDVIKSQSAHDLIGLDNAITAIDPVTLTLTMASPLPTDIAMEDWISPAGTSPVPQFTEELHSTLVLMAATRCLFTLGQLDQKQALDVRITENLTVFKSIMYPRGRGEPEIAVSPYFNF